MQKEHKRKLQALYSAWAGKACRFLAYALYSSACTTPLIYIQILTCFNKLLTIVSYLLYNIFEKNLINRALSQLIYTLFCVWIGWLFFIALKRRVSRISKTIYIRNVDAAVLAKIDELSKQKGISRNKMVNIILETYTTSDRVKELEDQYANLITTIADAINNNTIALDSLKEQIKENL